MSWMAVKLLPASFPNSKYWLFGSQRSGVMKSGVFLEHKSVAINTLPHKQHLLFQHSNAVVAAVNLDPLARQKQFIAAEF